MNASSIGPPGNRPTSASLEDEFPQAGLLVQPAIEMKRIEARELNLVDHGSLRAEQMASDHGVVPSAERDVEVELRVRPHRDAPVEGQQLVPLRECGLLVALRSEVPDLEVLELAERELRVEAVGAGVVEESAPTAHVRGFEADRPEPGDAVIERRSQPPGRQDVGPRVITLALLEFGQPAVLEFDAVRPVEI